MVQTMTPRKISVDPKSYEMAEYFFKDLKASSADIEALAQDIQTACEDACREVEERDQA
jgi:hypothetical protein